MGYSSSGPNINYEKIEESVGKKIKESNKWYKSWWMNLICGYILGVLSSYTVAILFS